MDTNILLESGTNELQVLEFIVGKKSFGINIAKVSEIIMYRPITPMPSAPDEVEGIFMPRDKLITVVDLHKVLHTPLPDTTEGLLIICEFNQLNIAFHVTQVKGLQILSWQDIEKPPVIGDNPDVGIATGIAKLSTGIMLILDFEKIISDLNGGVGLNLDGAENVMGDESIDYSKRIVIAEDSAFLNKLIVDTLHDSGYSSVTNFTNGEDAWEYVSGLKSKTKDILSEVAMVITDIEMPKMDGHHLTKCIKDDPILKVVPVFLFSSLIDDKMRVKGLSVGADEQFSKPQIGSLVETLAKYLAKSTTK